MAAEPGLRGSFWPTQWQKELLKAALFEGSDAITSWRKATSMVNLDDLEPESQRLLPLVYANLSRLDVQDSEMVRLKGLYKKTWFENELAFHRLAEVLNAFHESGVPTTVLKGAALADTYYRDRGARSMHDMDVLVPTGRWRDAAEILRRLDWQYSKTLNIDGVPRFRDGWEFKHRDGYRLDLHWHVIEYLLRTNRGLAGTDGRPKLVASEVAGVSTHILDHPDQLVHVCLHGARPLPRGNVIWPADAMTILRQVPDLDWDRVRRLTTSYRCTRAMGEALAYLSDEVGAPLPRSTVESLRATRINRREALGYWLTSGLDRGPRVRWMGCYIRLTAAWRLRDAVRGLPRYLQELQNLDRVSRVPSARLRRMFRTDPPSELDRRG